MANTPKARVLSSSNKILSEGSTKLVGGPKKVVGGTEFFFGEGKMYGSRVKKNN